MKRLIPYLLLAAALSIGCLSLFGEHSFKQLGSFRESLSAQRAINNELESTVRTLKKETEGLRNDPAAIERAARDELGMARPDEKLFIFESSKNDLESSVNN